MTRLDEQTLMIARTLREPTCSRREYERHLRWVSSGHRVRASSNDLLGRRKKGGYHHGG